MEFELISINNFTSFFVHLTKLKSLTVRALIKSACANFYICPIINKNGKAIDCVRDSQLHVLCSIYKNEKV